MLSLNNQNKSSQEMSIKHYLDNISSISTNCFTKFYRDLSL